MITQDELKQLLEYNPDTGEFTWRERPSRFSKRKAGDRAGCLDKQWGYRVWKHNSTMYREHRLVFLYTEGSYPKVVDHINRNKQDNRLCNLRIAEHAQNSWNCSKHADNISGVKGVSWDKSNNNWKAKFVVRGKTINVGNFSCKEKAAEAVRVARELHHGEFANHG